MIYKALYTTFTFSDLQWFSKKSGDYNPIHINKVKARRLISGEVVVPGMYLLLRALNLTSDLSKKNSFNNCIVS